MPTATTCPWSSHAAITQWAVAGGAMGYPVHIRFQNYPAPVIAELYRRLMAWIEKKHVSSIYGLQDFRQIQSKLDTTRLVLLVDENQLAKTCWLLELHRDGSGVEKRPSPVVFSSQNANAVGDLPGSTLVLHGYSPQLLTRA